MITFIINQFLKSHNPYFNRWFSAITGGGWQELKLDKVTILILIDGFLQLLNKILSLKH